MENRLRSTTIVFAGLNFGGMLPRLAAFNDCIKRRYRLNAAPKAIMVRLGIKISYDVLIFGTASVMLACSMVFPSVTPENVQTLRSICSELPVPNSFYKVRERSLEKPELVIYSAEYTSDEPPDAIESAFKEHLIQNGWEFFERPSAGERKLDFKKGRYSIHIEYLDPPLLRNVKYLVDCGYNVPGE